MYIQHNQIFLTNCSIDPALAIADWSQPEENILRQRISRLGRSTSQISVKVKKILNSHEDEYADVISEPS